MRPGPVEIRFTDRSGPGDRVYFGYGTATNGILQIVDRDKLFNDPSLTPETRVAPTVDQLLYPQISRYDHGPTNGAHTVFPIMNVAPPRFKNLPAGTHATSLP